MSIPTDLDAWAAGVAADTGYRVTRDADSIFPPCVYVDEPEITAATMPSIAVALPVYVIGEGTGKARLDETLTMLPAVMAACHTHAASPATLTIGGQDFTAYRLTVPVRIII
jgi:hypothetical protein